MDFSKMYPLSSNVISYPYLGSNVTSNNYTVPSNVPYNSPTEDILKLINSSPTSVEFNHWDSLPPSPQELQPYVVENKVDVSEPLINKTPSSRALKAKRCPTNKCGCGGKSNCPKESCQKSIGCFKCPVCELEFSRKNSMRRHVLTHINLRPYTCNDCDKSFYRSDIYKRHLVSKRCRRNKSNNQFLALCQNLPKVNPLTSMQFM